MSRARFARWMLWLVPGAALLTALPGRGSFCGWLRLGAAFALLWLLPALSWALALARPREDGAGAARAVAPIECAAWGLGLAFAASGLATLLLHLIPGPFPAALARFVYMLLALAPLPLSLSPSPPLPLSSSIPRYALLAILAVTLLARLPNLAYSEFQGDEAVIMQRAAQALAGDDAELFLHQKGPVELLTPMALWALTGTVNELWARLPFALAGTLAVLAVALLAARWFGSPAGLCAGLLAAINGFLVAFGRIVQYQSFVVAMGALCLLALLAYRRSGRRRYLLLSAALLAYGLLAHYDAVLVAPAALWLWIAALRERLADGKGAWRIAARHLGLAALLGAAVLAVFYLPFVAHPMFRRTFAYLAGGRLGGDAVFHNSLPQVWPMSTFYNALYYVVGLLLLVPLALLRALRRRERRLAPWLYFLVPLGFYLFIVADPRTHVYTFYPGAVILAGAALGGAWTWLRARGGARSRALALAGAALAGSWFALCAGYVYVAYVDHTPEYKRAWPESRHPLYPVPFESLPPYGHFGFPYRAGWKAVEALFARGVLAGTYASNEEPEVTRWYVRSGARTLCGQPDVYVVAEQVQDVVPIDGAELAREYHLFARVTVEGRARIAVYRREPPPGDPLTLAVEDVAAGFDAGATVARHLPSAYGGAHSVGVDVGGVGRLLGYDLSDAVARPGEPLRVTLYWEALTAPRFNHQVFVHLRREGQVLSQHDGAPACDRRPTSHWEPGEIVRDEHVVPIGKDIPSGSARLYAGMYDLLTLVPLPVDGTSETSILLTEVEVIRR